MKRAQPSFLNAIENSVDRRRRPRPISRIRLETLLADDRQSCVSLPKGSAMPLSEELDEVLEEQYEQDGFAGNELKEEETVKVCLRLRPYTKITFKIKENTLIARCQGENQSSSEKHYTFSNVFEDNVSQAEVYDCCIRPTIRPTIGEPGATYLTYGTSGSGKTYTLLGTEEQPGIVPRSIEQIYEELYDNISTEPSLKMECMKPIPLSDESVLDELRKLRTIKSRLQGCEESTTIISEIIQSQHQFQPLEMGDKRVFIWISFVEIYNENVYDLLTVDGDYGKRKPMKVLSNDGNAYIKGLSTLYAGTKEDAYNLLQYGLQSATYGATDVNSNSSRSHSIFTVTVITHSVSTQRISQSVYKFCDLAGSERLKKTGTTGDRLKEAQKINTSLLVLGRCLETVHKNQKTKKIHDLVPVRDSKLTMIIQSALLGKEPMTMIVNVYPTEEFYDENLNVLNFSSIAKQIVISKEPKIMKAPHSTRYSFFLSQAISSPSSKIDTNQLLLEYESLKHENDRLIAEAEQKNAEIVCLKKKLAIQEYQLRNELTDNFQQHFTKMEESYQLRIQSAQELAILPFKHQLAVLDKKLKSKEQTIMEMEDEQDDYEKKLKAYEEELNTYRLQQSRVRRLSASTNEDTNPPPTTCPELAAQNRRKIWKGKALVVIKTVESIFFNPILLMTLLGVIGGQIFPNGLPVYLSSVLRSLGNSFSATALFLLGLRMVGKASTLQGPGLILPGILILVKLLVFPLVTRQTVNIMNAGANFSETTDLSTFGFLYGTFPAAPGVFVIASQYNRDVDLIASSMVASTFISAPLMFISAKMITITNLTPADYLNELDKFSFDISIVAIIAGVWTLLLFALTRKVKRMPHRITCCLLVSQLICNVGVILWSTLEQNSRWKMYLQFYFFTIGCYSSRLWTAFLAITILFLQCRSLCFVLKLWPVFIAAAWGLPTLIVSLLLFLDNKNILPTEKRNPSFQYGNAQAAIAVFLLVMCFIVTVGCLILHQRFKKRHERYLTLSREVSSPDTDTSPVTTSSVVNLLAGGGNSTIHQRRRRSVTSSDDEILPAAVATGCVSPTVGNGGCNDAKGGGCCSSSSATIRTVVDIEDLAIGASINNDVDEPGSPTTQSNGMCSAQFNCPAAGKQQCQSLIDRYREQANDGLEPVEYDKTGDQQQILRHMVLLILLLCSMFVGLSLSVWTLIMEGMSGIYVELTFLDAFLNFGQSIIVLAVFITDTGELLLPMMKFWRKVWYGANLLQLPIWSDLSTETRHICDQFTTHHLEICRKAIAKDIRWRIKVYRRVFYGSVFVDWLLEVGLAKDRTDATHYARRLIDGRVLRHINNVYHFHDRNLLYTFCERL